jgi:excisionase family DNA binding protein
MTHDCKVLTLPEVARLLGLSRSSAYEAAAKGTLPLPIIRIGRRLVVPRTAVEHLLGEPLRQPVPVEGGDDGGRP